MLMRGSDVEEEDWENKVSTFLGLLNRLECMNSLVVATYVTRIMGMLLDVLAVEIILSLQSLF